MRFGGDSFEVSIFGRGRLGVGECFAGGSGRGLQSEDPEA